MTGTGIGRGLLDSVRDTETPSAPRVAVYLRVSTGRQVEHELSIPDQRAQTQAWAAQRGWRVVGEYIDGTSATDDKRPEFQKMIERACDGENAFDVIVVHSFSRFFRDAFGLEFYVDGPGSRSGRSIERARQGSSTYPSGRGDRRRDPPAARTPIPDDHSAASDDCFPRAIGLSAGERACCSLSSLHAAARRGDRTAPYVMAPTDQRGKACHEAQDASFRSTVASPSARRSCSA
jgi:Resolvase, N terminal domain